MLSHFSYFLLVLPSSPLHSHPFSCFSPVFIPCHLSSNLPLQCRMLLNFFFFFIACVLFCSLPPTRFGLLVAPSCQFLSGQLTGCCRAFPATRATGKRPSVALFDAPSPLILYTWTVLCTYFLLNRSRTHFLLPSFHASFLPSYSSPHPLSLLQHFAS